MPSLTECIENLKTNIETIAAQKMIENYDGLGNLMFKNEDTIQAKQFAASLQNSMTLHESELESYSKKSLQSAWNIATILSVVIQYMPCEWSAGFFRGLMASGTNKEINAYNLLISMTYMNEDFSVVPYIVDDITYDINRAFLSFTKEVQKTNNGPSIINFLNQLSHQFLNNTITLDEDVIKAAETGIQAYEQYKAQLSPAQIEMPTSSQANDFLNIKEQVASLRASFQIDEEDDELIYYDAKTGEEDELCAEITASALEFVVESLQQVHENRNDLGDDYHDTTDLFLKISDVILDPHANVTSMTDSILENEPLSAFLEKRTSKKWIQYISEVFDYLKQKIHQLMDSFKSNKNTTPHC